MRQSELCERANIPKSSLSLYLSGAYEPKQDRIFAMAKVLGVDEGWLMGYNVPMETHIRNATPSDRLQEIMIKRGLKQADLVRMTGISRGAVSNYILGRYEPKLDILVKFAKALGCSEMWLCGYDVPMECDTTQPLIETKTSDGRQTLASNLRLLMKNRGVSRNDLSDALGISYFTVSDWVNGKKYPRIDKIEMIASYFNVSTSMLTEQNNTDENLPLIKTLTEGEIEMLELFRQMPGELQKTIRDMFRVALRTLRKQ